LDHDPVSVGWKLVELKHRKGRRPLSIGPAQHSRQKALPTRCFRVAVEAAPALPWDAGNEKPARIMIAIRPLVF
jgi:hypothetical protein